MPIGGLSCLRAILQEWPKLSTLQTEDFQNFFRSPTGRIVP
ncbi:hypothetical protein 9081_00169 [Pseudomonas phage bmx-p3]|nr:hypothetical protein 9081_00169 [Pseudomonas phage bmx-p3]